MGSGIQLSGFSSSYGTIYGKSLSDVVNHTTDAFNSISYLIDFVISPDGTNLFYTQYNDGKIYERAISTAWDLSTISLTDTISGGHYLSNAPSTTIGGFTWSTDGMKLYVVYSNISTVAEFWNDPNYPQYAFRVDTLTYGGINKTLNTNLVSGNYGIIFKNDGTMVFIANGSTSAGPAGPSVYSWPLSTAWDLSTAGTRVQSNINFSSNNLQHLAMSADGTSMIVENMTNDNLQHFTLSTPFDITTMTETSQTHHINTVITGSMNNGVENPNSIQWADNGNRFFVSVWNNGGSLTSTDQKAIYQFSAGSAIYPYSQYSPALTNSSNGQINSSSWVDLDSMVADETKNDGDVFYAVSTDDRTSWGVIKDGDGVRKIARNNSGTWQYNNDGGTSVNAYYDIANAVDDSVSYTPSNPTFSNVMAYTFNSDGTKLYSVVQGTPWQHELSTAFDISTASSIGYNYSADIQDNNGRFVTFNPTGTKMYLGGVVNNTIYQYSLSSAFDLAGASVSRDTSKTFTITNASGVSSVSLNGMIFNNNGTKMYVINKDRIEQYSLSTAYDISTASYDSINFVVTSQETSPLDAKFNSDGTKLFVIGNGSDAVHRYTLSIAYDLSTISYDNISFNVLSKVSNAWSLNFNNDGSKMYISDFSGGVIYQWTTSGTNIVYETSETWVNGTNNNEHATLQEALVAQSFNRMDKAQLQAVTDIQTTMFLEILLT